MGVAATEDRFIISVPRLMGYKTLVVNAIFLAFGLASIIWPKITTPDPQSIGILFDQSTGVIVALMALANGALRLQSTGPAGPFKPVQSEDAKAEVTAVIHGSGKITKVTPSGNDSGGEPMALMMPLAAHLASLAPVDSWPVVNGVEHEEDCALRNGRGCTCLAHVPTRTELDPSTTVADALEGDRVFSPAIPPMDVDWARKASDGRAFGSAFSARASAFLAAFLMPSFLLFAGVAVATLPGCASIEQVSAIAQAETVEQRAFALYGSFTVMEERAADIIADKRIPKAVRKRIQLVDRAAKPAADTVIALARELKAARNRMSVAELGSTSEQVAALSAELSRALVTFGPKLSALVAAVNSAKS